MEEIFAIITHIEIQDVLDILVVAVLFYGLLVLLRETRSAVALRGMVAVLLCSFVIFFLAIALRLSATALIFRNFWTVAVLVFLIVFQNDFRRVLTEVGRLPVFRGSQKEKAQSITEIISAVQRMAEKKIGALIAFERRNPLKVYADTGTAIDSVVTSELLRTIFALYTPLHDGALIIRGDRIVAAGCILPIAEETPVAPVVGMRHRAALGLSIETDAIVIVVSEETGTISLVHDGKMERGESPESMRSKLEKLLNLRQEEGDEDDA